MKSVTLAAAILGGIVTACGSSPPSHYYQLSTQPAPTASPITHGIRCARWRLAKSNCPTRSTGRRSRGRSGRTSSNTPKPTAGPGRSTTWCDVSSRPICARCCRPARRLSPTICPPRRRSTVAVEVSRFDADKSGRVTLDASWEMLDKNAKVVGAPRPAKIVEPGSGSDSAAVAATMSRAVGGLADNIAGGLGGGSVASMR